MIDIHCHILFSVDDGPNSVGESIMMMHMAYENGTRVIVATPHVQRVSDSVENVIWSRIQANYQELVNYASVSLPQLKLVLGAEVMVSKNDCSQGIYLWHGSNHYGVNGSDWFLIEFPYDITYKEMCGAVEDLIQCGRKPIIAHIEMYKCLRGDLQQFIEEQSGSKSMDIFSLGINRLVDLKNKGAFLQVSSGTISGLFDMAARKWVLKAIEHGLVDFVASDGHSAIVRKPVLNDAFQQISQQFGALVAYRLFEDHPSRMLDNTLLHEVYVPTNRGRKLVAAAALLLALGIGGQSLMGFIDQRSNPSLPLNVAVAPASVNTVISEETESTQVAQSQAGEVELVEETVAMGAPKVEGSPVENLNQDENYSESMKQAMDQFQTEFKNIMDRYDSMATLLESEAKTLAEEAKTKEEREAILNKYNKRIGDIEAETDRLFVRLIEDIENKLKENKLSLTPVMDAREVYSTLKKEHRSTLVD